MRKKMAALAVAGPLLLGFAAASPALAQSPPVTLLCSPGTNGGTLAGGVCVLPAATAGHGNELHGTPTTAGTFRFTIKVTDSAGDQATEPGGITIGR